MLQELAATLAARGGRALVVGGGVRDHLMGREIEDWDVEVHGVEPEPLQQALRRFGQVSLVGRSFGVFKLRPRGWVGPEIDVSIPRRDTKVGPGHKGIAVEGDPWLGEREAARRRDLTVNAILVDLLTREVVDPFGGRADIAARRLRAVDRETFLEDPLRALRVVQFAARLGFDVDPGLIELCREAALDELPAERVLGEWQKLMLQGRQPSVGLRVAREGAILARLFAGTVEDPAVDVVVDRMAVAAATVAPPGRRLAWLLAAWLHRAAPAEVERVLDRLGVHRFEGAPCRELVVALIRHQDHATDTDAALRWLSTRAEVEGALCLVESRDGVDLGARRARAAALGVSTAAPPPLLQGRHLAAVGVAPGPEMGRLLAGVYGRQLDGDIVTVEQALEAALTARREPGDR